MRDHQQFVLHASRLHATGGKLKVSFFLPFMNLYPKFCVEIAGLRRFNEVVPVKTWQFSVETGRNRWNHANQAMVHSMYVLLS